jgi:hypothetical protein
MVEKLKPHRKSAEASAARDRQKKTATGRETSGWNCTRNPALEYHLQTGLPTILAV